MVWTSRFAAPPSAAFLAAVLTLGGLLCTCVVRSAAAYTPESPEVLQAVDRAVDYLERNYDRDSAGYYSRLGGMSLVGLAVFKHTRRADHSLVQAAVEKCRQVCSQGVPWSTESNYSVGIAILFLCELDAQSYRREVEILLRALLARQQAGGGWGYPDSRTGDTSQTQYAVLGMWAAQRRGVRVPAEAIERACNWLLRTQAPNGSWGYQGRDPGTFERLGQDKETLSLAAAGLSSVYICAELLGIIRAPVDRINDKPAALREIGAEEAARSRPLTRRVGRASLDRGILDGDAWFGRNLNLRATEYQHYYMYALERYMSFRELTERNPVAGPGWYNQGVELLRSTQAENGSWWSCEAGPVIDTSFGVLFLLRSTRNTLRDIVERSGNLRGGKILPPDLTQVTVDPRGRVVDSRATPPIQTLLSMLEDIPDSAIDTRIPDRLELSQNPQRRAAERARLERLAVSGVYQARLTAITTLGHDRDLDNVPVLIYALGDPDPRVVRAARDGLRLISRKLNGFGLSDNPDDSERRAVRERWEDWYRAIDPQGALIE